MINGVVFDLETAASDELFRRDDFLRIDGLYPSGGKPVITTDHAETTRRLMANPRSGTTSARSILWRSRVTPVCHCLPCGTGRTTRTFGFGW
jgi:hypothetical protein